MSKELKCQRCGSQRCSGRGRDLLECLKREKRKMEEQDYYIMLYQEQAEVIKGILNWLTEIKNNGCKGVVLGISGGKDSTVVAMLAKKIWGNNLIGVLIPNNYQEDTNEAISICEQLKIKTMICNIGDEYLNIKYEYFCRKDLDPIPELSTIEQAGSNIAPRLRMTVLYFLGQTVGYRVIGTSNYSEQFIGWTTKFGDSACDFNPIAHLTCTEVIKIGLKLAAEFELPLEFIIKTPADGITGKSDEENWGFSYKQLDSYIMNGTSGDAAVDKIIFQKHFNSSHKREMPRTLSRN